MIDADSLMVVVVGGMTNHAICKFHNDPGAIAEGQHGEENPCCPPVAADIGKAGFRGISVRPSHVNVKNDTPNGFGKTHKCQHNVWTHQLTGDNGDPTSSTVNHNQNCNNPTNCTSSVVPQLNIGAGPCEDIRVCLMLGVGVQTEINLGNRHKHNTNLLNMGNSCGQLSPYTGENTTTMVDLHPQHISVNGGGCVSPCEDGLNIGSGSACGLVSIGGSDSNGDGDISDIASAHGLNMINICCHGAILLSTRKPLDSQSACVVHIHDDVYYC